jgi:hypothetical protein
MVPVERLKKKCPVCGRNHYCMICPTGKSAMCTQVESGKPYGNGTMWLHRLDQPLPAFDPGPAKERPKRSDWYPQAVKYAENLSNARKQSLALHLGLPRNGLDCIALLGRWEEDGREFFTFPERDGQGNVIGLNRRYSGGEKKHMPGGARGITLPNGWDDETDKALWVVEGPTDTAAMVAACLSAVGRPSNVGGVVFLAEAIKRSIDPHRNIVVIGENDKKEDGLWPGLIGAISVAGGLQEAIGRPVFWSLAPREYKDVREYLTSELFDGAPWPVRGARLAEQLIFQMKPASHCPTGYQSAVNEAKKAVDFNPDKWQY